MKTLITPLFALGFSLSALAQDPCINIQYREQLDVNQVSTSIGTGGMNFFDCNSGVYEVPKGSGLNSNFAGSIWVSGLDDQNKIYAANQTYRQSESIFWPGPLDQLGNATPNSCVEHSRPTKLNRHEVEQFRAHYQDPNYQIPGAILNYPAKGNTTGNSPYSAPFVDVNSDGVYNPYDGDYPDFWGDGSCDDQLFGHQNVYTVYNDAGFDESMGIDIHQQSYAFHTEDGPSSTSTFYKYTVINRSNRSYHNTSFAFFMDGDLGNYLDDYVGVDVSRGMGYTYNGDGTDDGTNGYGEFPPALGHAILQGPLAEANDGIDNDFDGEVDEANERILHSAFVYFNNDFSVTGNPETAEDYYNYANALWRDGQPITYGVDGRNGSGVETAFMFPADSDPNGYATGGNPQTPWSEVTAGSTPSDRRFVHTVGNFEMAPGAIKSVHTSLIWSRDMSANDGSVGKLKADKDIIQSLFDSCFDIPCPGLGKELTVQASDNNYFFSYAGPADQVTWNFGDGNSSNDKFPKHQYTSNGSFEVCATVSNSCASETICMTIEVQNPTNGDVAQYLSLTRVQGQGNGGQKLSMTEASVNQAIQGPDYMVKNPEYHAFTGPVLVKVINENNLPEGDVFIEIFDTLGTAFFKLTNNGEEKLGGEVYSEGSTLFADWGIEIITKDFSVSGTTPGPTDGQAIGRFIIQDENAWLDWAWDLDIPEQKWLKAVSENFLECGYPYEIVKVPNTLYPLIRRGFAPYYLVNTEEKDGTTLPGAWSQFQSLNQPYNQSSVELVISPDKSTWTRVPVIEIQPSASLSVGQAEAFQLRNQASVDKNGSPDGSGDGYGWFPGYAVNLETGERLNIMFGENSADGANRGMDMVWNPSTELHSNGYQKLAGGHYVYIMNTKYQGDNEANNPHFAGFNNPTNTNLRNIYKSVSWVGSPVWNDAHPFLSSEVRVSLQLAKPFDAFDTGANLGHSNAVYKFNKANLSTIGMAEEHTIKSYPNPAGEVVRFELPTKTLNQHLEIVNLQGQVLWAGAINSTQMHVNLTGLPEGVLLYRIREQGQIHGKLIHLKP